MLRRTRKQLFYGTGYLCVVMFLGVGLYLLVRPEPAPVAVAPTPTPQHQPVTVEEVAVIRHEPDHPAAARTVDIAARLRNPNLQAGSANYPVTFVLQDPTGAEIQRQTEAAYLLPGSVQYVAAIDVPVEAPVGQVEVEIPANPTLQELPASMPRPTFGTFLRERTTTQVGNAVVESQKGIVRNTSTFDFDRVEVTALALGANQEVVGVGKTFLGRLTVGESREFTVTWPKPARETVQVVATPSTNIFQENNVLEVIGDPGQLR